MPERGIKSKEDEMGGGGIAKKKLRGGVCRRGVKKTKGGVGGCKNKMEGGYAEKG